MTRRHSCGRAAALPCAARGLAGLTSIVPREEVERLLSGAGKLRCASRACTAKHGAAGQAAVHAVSRGRQHAGQAGAADCCWRRTPPGAVNAKELPEWEEFRDDVMAGAVRFPSRRTPFLFSGGPARGLAWQQAPGGCACRHAARGAWRGCAVAGAWLTAAWGRACCVAGIIIDSPAAAVYKLVQDQELVGVMVSSEADASH